MAGCGHGDASRRQQSWWESCGEQAELWSYCVELALELGDACESSKADV